MNWETYTKSHRLPIDVCGLGYPLEDKLMMEPPDACKWACLLKEIYSAETEGQDRYEREARDERGEKDHVLDTESLPVDNETRRDKGKARIREDAQVETVLKLQQERMVQLEIGEQSRTEGEAHVSGHMGPLLCSIPS